jgi:fermentation-respiration switch protein FrsA (DUF1100 family)
MDGGRVRDRFRPWSLDRDVWEPRVGDAALRAYRRSSWWWLTGLLLALLNVGRATAQLDASASPGLALVLLGAVLWVAFAIALTVAYLQRKAFDRLVLDRHGLPSSSARSLKTPLLRHPEQFDAWVVEQRSVAYVQGYPPSST